VRFGGAAGWREQKPRAGPNVGRGPATARGGGGGGGGGGGNRRAKRGEKRGEGKKKKKKGNCPGKPRENFRGRVFHNHNRGGSAGCSRGPVKTGENPPGGASSNAMSCTERLRAGAGKSKVAVPPGGGGEEPLREAPSPKPLRASLTAVPAATTTAQGFPRGRVTTQQPQTRKNTPNHQIKHHTPHQKLEAASHAPRSRRRDGFGQRHTVAEEPVEVGLGLRRGVPRGDDRWPTHNSRRRTRKKKKGKEALLAPKWS